MEFVHFRFSRAMAVELGRERHAHAALLCCKNSLSHICVIDTFLFRDCFQCWLQVGRILVFANCRAKCRAMFLAYGGMCLASRRLDTIALCALRRGRFGLVMKHLQVRLWPLQSVAIIKTVCAVVCVYKRPPPDHEHFAAQIAKQRSTK